MCSTIDTLRFWLCTSAGASAGRRERRACRAGGTCLRISQPLYFLYTWNSGVNRFGGFDTCVGTWGASRFWLAVKLRPQTLDRTLTLPRTSVML